MLSEKIKKYLEEVGLYDLTEDISYREVMIKLGKYRSWKQEKEKNAYLIEIEDILPVYSLSCINRNRLRKE